MGELVPIREVLTPEVLARPPLGPEELTELVLDDVRTAVARLAELDAGPDVDEVTRWLRARLGEHVARRQASSAGVRW